MKLRRTGYHLVIETPKANLVDGMKWFQTTYTRRFNVKNGQWGHLFGGRYKAIVVQYQEGDPRSFVTPERTRSGAFFLEVGVNWRRVGS